MPKTIMLVNVEKLKRLQGNMMNKEFARELNITETLLSRLYTKKPNENRKSGSGGALIGGLKFYCERKGLDYEDYVDYM